MAESAGDGSFIPKNRNVRAAITYLGPTRKLSKNGNNTNLQLLKKKKSSPHKNSMESKIVLGPPPLYREFNLNNVSKHSIQETH